MKNLLYIKRSLVQNVVSGVSKLYDLRVKQISRYWFTVDILE